jgi:hypothetical protein
MWDGTHEIIDTSETYHGAAATRAAEEKKATEAKKAAADPADMMLSRG